MFLYSIIFYNPVINEKLLNLLGELLKWFFQLIEHNRFSKKKKKKKLIEHSYLCKYVSQLPN